MADGWLITAVRVNDRSAADLKANFFQGTVGVGGTNASALARRFVSFAVNLLRNLLAGTKRGQIFAVLLDNAGTRATGNVACTQANAAGNFVRWTYGGQTITLTEGVDFARGASDTTCAANLAAAINAHAVLGPLFTALGSSGDCGLTANFPTALPHDFAMSTDDATAFSFTQMTGGTEGAAQFMPGCFDVNTGS